MKKMMLMMIWSITCLSATGPSGQFTEKVRQKAEKQQQEQQRPHELPSEVVDSLIEHSPKLVKRYLEHLKYSITTEEIDPKTLFLYGPSGVGKTETAIALAQKIGIPFTVIDATFLGNKYQNSAKNQLEELLLPIINSDQKHMIIIDECTRLVENYNEEKGSREDNGTATAFWKLLEQCIKSKSILVIATANSIERCPEMVKTRFGNNRFVEFKMPDMEARKKILRLYMPKDISCSEEVLNGLAKQTEGVSPRNFKNIINAARSDLKCSKSGRVHFVFADFKEELERIRDANKVEGTMSKMVTSIKNEAVADPFGLGSKVGGVFTAAIAIAYGVGKVMKSGGNATEQATKQVIVYVSEGIANHGPELAQTTSQYLATGVQSLVRFA